MTKKRKIKIWKIILNEIENKDYWVGICDIIERIYITELIMKLEWDEITKDLYLWNRVLRNNRQDSFGYFFSGYNKHHRIKFVKRIIAELESQ